MRMIPACALVVFAVFVLGGCGSSPSYADDARAAIKSMSSTISRYDATRPSDVASTGRACSAALASLESSKNLATATPPARYKRLGNALREAYTLAHAGFSDCAQGAAASNYARMVQADSELTAANSWIAVARRLN